MQTLTTLPSGVEPLPGKVLVTPVAPELRADGLIADREAPVGAYTKGRVLACDPDDTTGDFKEGDVVLFESHAAYGVRLRGAEFMTVSRQSIVCVVA